MDSSVRKCSVPTPRFLGSVLSGLTVGVLFLSACNGTGVPPSEPEPPDDTSDVVLGPGPHLDSVYWVDSIFNARGEEPYEEWSGECVYQGQRHPASLVLDADSGNDFNSALWGQADESEYRFKLSGFINCTHPSSPAIYQRWQGPYEVARGTLQLEVDSILGEWRISTPEQLLVDSLSSDDCWVERVSTVITVDFPDNMFFEEGGDIPLDTLQFPVTLGPPERAGERPPCGEES